MTVNDVTSAGLLLAYYLVVCALLPTLLKVWAGAPFEMTRKMQHIAYSLSIFLLLELFSSWYAAVGAAFLLVILAYPTMLILERFDFYGRTFVDRERGGELRKQLLYVQLSFALLIFIFWGLLGAQWRYVAAVAIMAWGFGDAAAALVGKAYGHRRVVWRKLIESRKTVEGTTAMIVTAGLALFVTLVFYGQQPWPASLLIAAAAAPVCGAVELFSRRGADTLTVPFATGIVVLPLLHLASLWGG